MTEEMMVGIVEETIEEMGIVITIAIVTIVKMEAGKVIMIVEETEPHLQ